MHEDTNAARVDRLQETLATIERMLREQRRNDYFEALRQKRATQGTGNVTTAFFAGHI